MPAKSTDIQAIALLDEPIRRSLYEWVVTLPGPAGRDEAAAAVGISRALAAFHLDRLVEGGLLVTEYRRLSGRTGPGAGRPAKLYSRAPREFGVTLPDRRYEKAARVLALAMEQMGDGAPPEPLRAAARRVGHEGGAMARTRIGRRASRMRTQAALLDTLREQGYEPRALPDGEIRLGNCPFDALVEDHRDLVCGMNLALADGLLEGLGDAGHSARLDPQPGMCCVAISRD
jgi:predicted ArsR family transcriptional regulator